MSSKAALKAIRAALDSREFAQAAIKARELCQQDPQNYHAHIFLGLALDKLHNAEEAELAYHRAAKIKDSDRTAWQGLISLYETQGDKKLDSYHDALTKLAGIFAAIDEKTKCQAIVQKFISFVKRNGSKAQLKRALQLLLPTSPLYDALEGTIGHPAQNYLRVIELAELEEREFINREIGERRTRIGARIEQVTIEVHREAFRRSDLDDLYRALIDWSNDDEVRRTYEEKLLRRAYEYLHVLPADKKSAKRKEILQLAEGMVIIKHPFDFAWKIVLEWKDLEELSELDISLVREFIELFSSDGLSKVLRGYLESDISPFPKDEKVEKEKTDAENEGLERVQSQDSVNNQITAEDRLLLMAEGLQQCPSSVLSHRIMAELYLSLEELQTTVDVCRNALEVVKGLQQTTGLKFTNTVDAINITIATALTSYQSPKNHPEAKQIFENVLKRKPKSTPCLLGIGIILQEDEDYAVAVDFLEQAAQRNPTNIKVRSELFWCKAHNGDLEAGLHGLEETLSMIKPSQPRSQDLKSEVLYRIGYCQWELGPSPAARKDRTAAYARFLGSIQANMNYAPAYSSLGVYYADYKKDQKRARRCFHKAFELSASEIESAERLARAFADDRDWDLVEAVSQRVVDSGKARPAPGSKRTGHSWPYTALGVVEINRQQYTKSVVHFQAALRISPNDYQSWVGLGESYHSSGRYIAATKAFQHAETLEAHMSVTEREQVWFARYMLANVKRELGEYEDAIARYEEVLGLKPSEFGVSIALLQTLAESAWRSVELGVYGEAAETARKAILTGVSVAKHHARVFNLWKTIGDAFSTFSWIKGKTSAMPITEFKKLLESQSDNSSLQLLEDVDNVGTNFAIHLSSLDDESSQSGNAAIYAAILAYKRAVSISASDVHAQAVAWYNLGWAEFRAYACMDGVVGNAKSKHGSGFLKASMRCFKKAIELEAGNAEFWNALGVATTSPSPKVAQHSFVRSLHLNDKNPHVWTNLGALYLLNNEHELANEAFTKAQSADPDFSHAWVGQGLLALLYGDATEARELFTHAFEIGNASSVFPKRQYPLSVFDYLASDPATPIEIQQLIRPLFALLQLRTQSPSNHPYEHITALFAERIGDFPVASTSLNIVCGGVESEYEVSESIPSLLRFAHAKCDAARVKLAELNYKGAVEDAETALYLSSEEGVEDHDPELYRKLRLSAHLTAGLACYYLKDMDKAIDMFRNALQEADSSPDIVCVLAQMLWAKGGEDERNVAREQLFDCVERHPEHVGAVTLLGVIALLDADEDAIEAVESDLQEMRTRNDLDLHNRAKVTQILAAISAFGRAKGEGIPEELGRIQEATTSVMLFPNQSDGWRALSSASSEPYPADMALEMALRSIPPRGPLTASDLCKAYTLSGERQDALRAIMVAPWAADSWEELHHSIA
ncbi:hypothetical protein AJ80_02072 [Polytolypa hystricis UAMH7299]|uniref:Superkiller protein 3 n=1 Tax=Polytolypa hystricis (strain UAMH7299) TaxID=1447883 RepID=A0A2B7YIC1_POLH7|nr:hypothetical protein AJ80_02072 [Polytolypa hystricis UAMH7299]